jgi:hypothetical protein
VLIKLGRSVLEVWIIFQTFLLTFILFVCSSKYRKNEDNITYNWYELKWTLCGKKFYDIIDITLKAPLYDWLFSIMIIGLILFHFFISEFWFKSHRKWVCSFLIKWLFYIGSEYINCFYPSFLFVINFLHCQCRPTFTVLFV